MFSSKLTQINSQNFAKSIVYSVESNMILFWFVIQTDSFGFKQKIFVEIFYQNGVRQENSAA